MSKIHFHPTEENLALFAAGELTPDMSIMVSAHLEHCIRCRQRVAELEANYAEALTEDKGELTTEVLSGELTAMLNQVLSVSLEPEVETQKLTSATLKIEGKEFTLPRALQHHQDKIGPWSRLPGKLKRAHVATGSQSKMNFIYMDADSALPQHTHGGQEITLVLAGEFVDEHGTYGPGDFIVQTSADQHSPRTLPGQDCLCLALLDAPLRFTSGLATLLNPFSQLFFK